MSLAYSRIAHPMAIFWAWSSRASFPPVPGRCWLSSPFCSWRSRWLVWISSDHWSGGRFWSDKLTTACFLANQASECKNIRCQSNPKERTLWSTLRSSVRQGELFDCDVEFADNGIDVWCPVWFVNVEGMDMKVSCHATSAHDVFIAVICRALRVCFH